MPFLPSIIGLVGAAKLFRRSNLYLYYTDSNSSLSLPFSISLSIYISRAAYNSSPAHVEIIAEEKNEEIAKEKDETATRLSRKQLAQKRAKKTITTGGGV